MGTKKNRKVTDAQWWFVWKTIHELEQYVGNLLESGGKGLKKDLENGAKARKIIQQHRNYQINLNHAK